MKPVLEGKIILVGYGKSRRRKVWSKCGYCKKKILVTVTGAARGEIRHCSVACRNKAKPLLGKKNPNWRGGLPTKLCLHCHSPFIPNRGNKKKGFGKFCTHQCSANFRKGKRFHSIKARNKISDGVKRSWRLRR